MAGKHAAKHARKDNARPQRVADENLAYASHLSEENLDQIEEQKIDNVEETENIIENLDETAVENLEFEEEIEETGHYAIEDKKKAPVWLFIIIGLVAVLGITAVVFFVFFKGDVNEVVGKPTEFIEETIETAAKDETISVEDPWLGTITIDIVKGAAKNSYDKEAFVTDDITGIKTYMINGEKASAAGIDLSEYQGEVDFKKLKAQGIEFVMLRIGGRGYGTEGEIYMDNMFETNYTLAKSAGLKIGAYFYSQAISEEEAKQEADYVVKCLDGKKLDYPVAFDWELIENDDARTENVTNEELTSFAKAFCDKIKEQKYQPIIYSYTYVMYQKYDLAALKDYDFWVADYGDTPSMYYGFTMWQYTNEGKLEGIEGNVDINVCFKNY